MTQFESLSELDAEVLHRRSQGHDVVEANGTKERQFGFLDMTADEYLYVSFARLSSAQISSRVAGEADPDLTALFTERLESDISDEEILLEAGEREAAKNWDKFPTPEQTALRVEAIQQALNEYDLARSGGRFGDPFRFSWHHSDRNEHHGDIAVTTDHLGITCVVTPDGEWTRSLQLTRLAWVDVLDASLITEWVQDQMKVMWPIYKGIPRCVCQKHQRDRARI